jgi:hypothetical protein
MFKNVYQFTCTRQKLPDDRFTGHLRIMGPLVWNLLELTLLASRVWRCLLDFLKILGSLFQRMKLVPISSCVYCIFVVRMWLSIHFFPSNNQLKYLPTFYAVAAVQNF